MNAEAQKNVQPLKLNIQRTLLVGLAFFTITIFWEVYDGLIPLFINDFELGDTIRGIIMSLDNILALVLLPFMGLLSDKFPMTLRAKFGRRMPFIVCGSILAAVTFLLVNLGHTQNSLGLMMTAVAFVLVFMCLYRSPAVALMPDVTPKQIRSQGNLVINLMGGAGGIIALVLMNLLTNKFDNWVLFAILAALMISATVVMIFKVKENKFVEEKMTMLKEMGIDEDDNAQPENGEKVTTKKVLASLAMPQLISLLLILVSVALWYIAYNGVKSHFSVFSEEVLLMPRGEFTLPLLIATVSGFFALFPSAMLGKKIGRKNTVLIGVLLLIAGFGLCSLLLTFADIETIKIAMYPAFVLVGLGWATINVHSYVMSVELADKNTTGVFTGLYYTFAMGAQVIAPILAGALMEFIGSKFLMINALIFSCLALLTMFFVRHGNARIHTEPSDAATILDVLENTDAEEIVEENMG